MGPRVKKALAVAQSIAPKEDEFKLSAPGEQEGGGFSGSEPKGSVTIDAQGRVFRVSISGVCKSGEGRGGARGEVQEFSAGSRRRLAERLARADVRAMMGQYAARFVTITYPADYPSARSSKGHLAALFRRVRRRYGEFPAFWKLERQKRGAPHYHFVCFGIPWLGVQWLREAWGEIIGYRGQKRLQVDVEEVRSAKQVCAYLCKYVAKAEAPARATAGAAHANACGPGVAGADGADVQLDHVAYSAAGEEQGGVWDCPGRFWGIWNRALVVWCGQELLVLPLGPWVYRVRRAARRFWRGTGKHKGQGFMLFCQPEGWLRLVALCLYVGA